MKPVGLEEDYISDCAQGSLVILQECSRLGSPSGYQDPENREPLHYD